MLYVGRMGSTEKQIVLQMCFSCSLSNYVCLEIMLKNDCCLDKLLLIFTIFEVYSQFVCSLQLLPYIIQYVLGYPTVSTILHCIKVCHIVYQE